ncbi:MAG: MBL fold metallo-hydrolase [Prevotellaceae bacterium]|jgi:glyoxylase-like metal-dependent hydrolase (beta-lactamase superfamily II)|nr:MBL fold metallo-hydrolase [Prevotellaceae bacterium]
MRNTFILLITILLFSKVCFAQSQISKNVFTTTVGEYEVSTLLETQQDGRKDILINATPEMLKKYMPTGTYFNATSVFLVRTPNKAILFDAGFGRNLFDNIQSLGIGAEDINAIFLTHMHGDHIGGLLKDGNVTFPNADIYMSKMEHDYWMSDESMLQVPENKRRGFVLARNVIAAYKNKLRLFTPSELNGKKTDLTTDIQGIATYGHTPGHTSYLISSKGSCILIWGDITHVTTLQVENPDVAVTYDVNPADAINIRKNVLEYVTKNKIPIAGMHVPFPGMGEIKINKEKRYEFIPYAK